MVTRMVTRMVMRMVAHMVTHIVIRVVNMVTGTIMSVYWEDLRILVLRMSEKMITFAKF